ncbi:hypothetical protein [Streptomyces sp. NPDC050504]|uniref:hypothetical protein n=1 Tax=Streptomyces sp. NPDC050504 TaxID=3365618 RepID=UPI0037B026E8
MIGACIPERVLRAEYEAECAAREVYGFRGIRGPLGAEDRADRESALAELARANKVLAAHNPGLVVRPLARRGGGL